MIFASKKSEHKDGELCLISRDLKSAVSVSDRVPSFREAIEDWHKVKPQLQELNEQLNAGLLKNTFKPDPELFGSALPRTWLFADGSAYLHHIRLVRKARNTEPPETLTTIPLMYQAESGRFLAPTENIPQRDFAHGTDFEGEVGVIVDHVPMGIDAKDAIDKILFIVLINDVSLRGLIPAELAMGFGFFQSKPTKALSPYAVTPEELGESWREGRLHLPLHVELNGQTFGCAEAGEMHFHFGELIAHAAKTRDLMAGSLIGSGTVSNEDPTKGSSCLVEKRTIEQLETGAAKTPYLRSGDQVEIYMKDRQGREIFGRIKQKVVQV